MTNKEKFKEIFGFIPNKNTEYMCPAPPKICGEYIHCQDCPFNNWWDKEYMPCFKLREDLEDVETKS